MHVLKFIVGVSKPYRLYLYGMMLAMILVASVKNATPYLIKTIIDYVNSADYGNIWMVVVFYALIQVTTVGAWNFYDYCISNYFPQLTASITKTLLAKIILYPYRFFQESFSGSISAKINDAAKHTPVIIDTIILELFQILVMMIISIALLTRVYYGFGIAIILWLLIFLSIAYIFMKKIVRLSEEKAEANSTVWGRVIDCLANIFSVKIFASGAYEQNRLDQHLKEFIAKDRAMRTYLRAYFSTQGIVFSFYILGLLCAMIYLSKQKLITTGDFALVFMLNFEIVNWLFNLTQILREFLTRLGELNQALSMFTLVPEIQDKPDAKILKINKGQIIFDKVKFHYKGTEALFENKSVIIEAGQKVGLVGYSGGGKTTFINLILRLYDITDGKILIDNQDIYDVTQDSLRAQIAMIPQDSSLFHRTLMENIRYGRLDATDSEIIKAAKYAHADEFIDALPQGYQSLVGERGVKLSGGQRQRIAIARAVLKNAPILILDEATSQLDSITESYIQESLMELMNNKTTIIIAHCLSTLLHMDRILVFDKGKIIEDGKHSELLNLGGLYKTLWNAQVGGFLPDKKNEDEL